MIEGFNEVKSKYVEQCVFGAFNKSHFDGNYFSITYEATDLRRDSLVIQPNY